MSCCGSLVDVSDVKYRLRRSWIKSKKLKHAMIDTDSLRRGPGVNVQDDKNGYTPLHNACMHGHKEIVRLLLAADASPCIVASKGVTPLHLAAWKGGSEIVAMLLAHTTNPVNVDQLTSDHETALLIAAQYKGRTDVISQLLEHGADVSICNSNDESALDLAARLGRIETVQLLIQARPSLIDPYKPRACRGRIFPSTPLHLASKHDHKDVVIALLEAGVDPNIQTSTGTPLHEAACFSRVSVVRTLLARGANLYAKDKKGKTVYDLLSSYSDEATRVVRSVLREFEERSRNNLYESEDDLPPFPVQDCSPIYGMKTPETQNVTNKKESLISPSSLPLANNGPQSFVKKLASKYLGIKAKFSSTPNISNDSTSDVKSNHNSTGKSNFFRILPKKEVYGEVVCNNEFDTISLDRDRMVPLSRDTVVNRSNRSCPGFKISLQNIYENNEHDELSEIQDLGTSSESNVVELNEAINHVANNNNIFEPREKGDSTSILSNFSQESHNECYEPYELNKENNESAKTHNSLASTINIPQPTPRSAPNINIDLGNDSPNNVKLNTNIVSSLPTPAVRTHIPSKRTLNPVEEVAIYENVSLSNVKPDPPKRTVIPSPAILNYSDSESSSSNLSRSSTLSSASMEDESNLEDILLSKKSKSFRLIEASKINDFRMKADLSRTESNASAISQCTEVSAMENVDCSGDKDQNMILSMTGTLPNKKNNPPVKKKVLFRHKTFTNIEIDRRSTNVRDLPTWNSSFLKETLSRYHIRGTGHCIYKAPTIQEFMNLFNSESLYNKDNLNSVSRNSKFETAICFCKPKYSKHYKSAEDLLNMTDFETDEKVFIDEEALNKRRELNMTSFRCFCESENCVLHDIKRESQNDLVVKFSAISKSISTPDITLNNSLPTRVFCRKKSTPNILEEPYAVVSVEQIIKRNKANEEVKIDCPSTPSNISMTTPSTLSSTFERPYSIKDIEEISLSNSSTSTNASLNCASNPQLPLTKSSSEYSGHWTLYTCNSNVTIKSDVSYKSCFEEQADSSDDTLHSDEEVSDTDTLKSDTSDTKRPWVHSSSFRFGSKDAKSDDVIAEETNVSPDLDSSSKFESGIGSENSLDESGDGVEADVLGALLERGGLSGGVRSGSGRRRWDEAEATSEGDALSVSSAASSCAPLYLAHHHDYNKVSPTPPKKPPRRNLSVSPTHANSPSSGYSYELRPHARSQDDLDDIQGAKHYLKHGRSVDQYVDGKLSYSEYEENHSSPRIVPVANPRPSLKNRAQPVAITAVYENVSIKEQNPKRKLKRISSNATQYENYEPRMTENRIRKNSNQTRSSSESLLDSQSINSPSDCERYYDSHRIIVPRSPTHYDQPPTPDHPPPTPRQAENSIHERIRPLSQLIMEVVEEIRIRKKSQCDNISDR